jgi:predicted Zn-ribbon and HTH transcriptional regulator
MTTQGDKILELKCKRCGHEWVRRVLKRKPVACPRCHSPYWDRERVKVVEGKKEKMPWE